MIISSLGKNIRGSAQKARIPAKVVIGMKANDAIAVLEYMPKKAAKYVMNVVKAAVSNGEKNFNISADELYVSNVRVDKAFALKRFRAGSRGNANRFNKHYCHVLVELTDAKVSAKTQEKEAIKEVKESKPAKKKAVTKKDAKKDNKKGDK